MSHVLHSLKNRRYGKNRVAYCESREQALIGDKTLIFGVKYEEMGTSQNQFIPKRI